MEAFAAVHGTPLSGLERNGCFFAALRADGFGFDALNGGRSLAGAAGGAAGFAGLAPLGLVFEALVGEKHLLAGGEDELSIAIGALQDLIVVFHALLRDPCWDRTGSVATPAGGCLALMCASAGTALQIDPSD